VEVRVTTVSRRAFLETGLTGLLTIGLLDTLVAGDAVPPAVDPILKSWLWNLHDHCGDLRDYNVHWLAATSKVAATFDVIVPGLDPARPTEFMDYVDPRRAESIGDGTLRAPRPDQDEVFKRYGHTGA